MSVMKQVVLNMSQKRVQPDNIKPKGSRSTEHDPFKHLAHSQSLHSLKSPGSKVGV